LSGRRLVHEVVRHMIDYVVTDLVTTTQAAIDKAAPKSIDDVRHHGASLVGFSPQTQAEHTELKRFLRAHVYDHYRVQRMTTKAKRMLRELFDALMEDVNLMPPEHRDTAHRLAEREAEAGKARAVADYIAGMTDRYAILEHRRLFDPAERT
jgi:dGTPase